MENNQIAKSTITSVVPAEVQDKFALACQTAEGLQTLGNYVAAFQAVTVVSLLREVLTDEVMDKVFMPLMNTKVGFLTDHNPSRIDKKTGRAPQPYSREIVRDAIIDAVSIGLTPTGNQFNIIAERMYPTKEGYTYLLRRLNIKYYINVGLDKNTNPNFAEIPCCISYERLDGSGEKGQLKIDTTVKKDGFSSSDQLRGKAERRAKKALYEYLTGHDYGEADEYSSAPQPTVSQPSQEATQEQKNAAAAAFAGAFGNAAPGQVEDIKPNPEPQPQKGNFQEELAKSKANMGL